MLGRQLATLLLVGLSLSSHLSEARRSKEELIGLLRQAANVDEVHFVELGDKFKDFAELRNVSTANCTPMRILFQTNVRDQLGEAAQQFVEESVERQRVLCRATFASRQWGRYQGL